MSAADDNDLLAEQRDFYDADARSFDDWLDTLLDEGNDDPTAVGFRAGRAFIASVFESWAPLGRTLEVAAGTGRLAQLHVPHASSTTLLDSSPAMLALAARRLGSSVDVVEADVFTWDDGETFDTILFSAWLHHVPLDRFDGFWRTIGALLAPRGRVLFDFQDRRVASLAATGVPPDEPTTDYGFYEPVDGISVRDHFGTRWRVVHHRWDPDDLVDRLASIGWTTRIVGPGLFRDVVWAEAQLGTSAT